MSYPYYGALMSSTPSKPLLSRDIDPRKFAKQGLELEGSIAVEELPRLSEALAEGGSEVGVALAFDIDEQGLKVVTGNVKGTLSVTCQRCLEAVPLEVEADFNLALAWDEDEAKQLPRRLDPWIVGEGATDIYTIVEEELLLALPMVAYHEEPCLDATLYQSGEVEAEDVEPRENPFQMLEQLKSSPKS
jgi:DUF177 domain-containing protein